MILSYHASLSSRDAFSDRQLTLNIERVEIICVPTCLYPKKRNPPSFVNISPTVVINASIEKSSQVLQHGNPKTLIFFSKKF